ncbi:hypothetical protein EJ04DRAFT_448355 [Polyplosphaeria fusca]|uniref:Uncharacterized protein n=1 Tax=Polyplosphaeria fusca TaxID=682080 RepID=A0A9P4UUI0_9PLEO|nr:hypothetical protein EJ04DRAFT_448355 [Polyplosphaeria fusca]
MTYYHCTTDDLRQEIRRRGYIALSSHDVLAEWLQNDDEDRATEATTVANLSQPASSKVKRLRTAHGEVIAPSALIGEEVVYWTMNTFFPALQLFFKSGRSCTIDGGRLRDASVGLDPHLRFRLTDLTHEENGVVEHTVLPEKFRGPAPGIRIVAAEVAQRISIRVQPVMPTYIGCWTSLRPKAEILREMHQVVGLKLEGMQEMAYIWAKTDPSHHMAERLWGDVEVCGLRADIPRPLVTEPHHDAKSGARVEVVRKKSMIEKCRLPIKRCRRQDSVFGLSSLNLD